MAKPRLRCCMRGSVSRDDELSGESFSIQNQLTRRVHETGRFYDADLEELRQSHERLWDAAQSILTSLAKIQ